MIRKVEDTCKKLVSVFYKIGGSFTKAADAIEEDIQKTVRENLSFDKAIVFV